MPSWGRGRSVTRDVPDYGLVVGNPARQTGWMCRCGVKLEAEHSSVECGACGAKYLSDEGGVHPV